MPPREKQKRVGKESKPKRTARKGTPCKKPWVNYETIELLKKASRGTIFNQYQLPCGCRQSKLNFSEKYAKTNCNTINCKFLKEAMQKQLDNLILPDDTRTQEQCEFTMKKLLAIKCFNHAVNVEFEKVYIELFQQCLRTQDPIKKLNTEIPGCYDDLFYQAAENAYPMDGLDPGYLLNAWNREYTVALRFLDAFTDFKDKLIPTVSLTLVTNKQMGDVVDHKFKMTAELLEIFHACKESFIKTISNKYLEQEQEDTAPSSLPRIDEGVDEFEIDVEDNGPEIDVEDNGPEIDVEDIPDYERWRNMTWTEVLTDVNGSIGNTKPASHCPFSSIEAASQVCQRLRGNAPKGHYLRRLTLDFVKARFDTISKFVTVPQEELMKRLDNFATVVPLANYGDQNCIIAAAAAMGQRITVINKNGVTETALCETHQAGTKDIIVLFDGVNHYYPVHHSIDGGNATSVDEWYSQQGEKLEIDEQGEKLEIDEQGEKLEEEGEKLEIDEQGEKLEEEGEKLEEQGEKLEEEDEKLEEEDEELDIEELEIEEVDEELEIEESGGAQGPTKKRKIDEQGEEPGIEELEIEEEGEKLEEQDEELDIEEPEIDEQDEEPAIDEQGEGLEIEESGEAQGPTKKQKIDKNPGSDGSISPRLEAVLNEISNG